MSKRILAILLSFFVYGIFLGNPVSKVQADNDTDGVICDSISINGINITTNNTSRTTIPYATATNGNTQTYNIEVCGDLTQANGEPLIVAEGGGFTWTETLLTPNPSATDDSCVSGSFDVNIGDAGKNVNIDIETQDGNIPICRRGYVRLQTGSLDEWAAWNDAKAEMCNITTIPTSNITTNDNITVIIPMPDLLDTNRTGRAGSFENPSGQWEDYQVVGERPDGGQFVSNWIRDLDVTADGAVNLNFVGSDLGVGTYTIRVDEMIQNQQRAPLCTSFRFSVGTPQNPGGSEDLFDPGMDDIDDPEPFELCKQLPADSPARAECERCRDNADGSGVWTAVGCINAEPGPVVATLVRIGLSLGGGIAILMILSAGFMFTTSQGDPNKTKEAKELMQSAVIGLLFIIFSVTILQFIGVTILQIPGFGGA